MYSVVLRLPAATAFEPSMKIARAKVVAVVVPSPAWSFVFCATDLISCAPRFSNLSLNSIAFATVTPSFVIRGAPNVKTKANRTKEILSVFQTTYTNDAASRKNKKQTKTNRYILKLNKLKRNLIVLVIEITP